MENAAYMEAEKISLADTPLNLHDGVGKNYSAVFQRVQKGPTGHIPQKRVRWVKKLDRGGNGVYTSCDCRRRNGLQDDCRITVCHGRPECLTDPPTCLPCREIWYD
jgi:hypothetical protein